MISIRSLLLTHMSLAMAVLPGVSYGETPGVTVPGNATDPIVFCSETLAQHGLDQSNKLLAVHVAGSEQNPAVFGTYRAVENCLSFTPDFPFLSNVEYVVRTAVADTASTSFKLEADTPPTPTVAEIYPTVDVLPRHCCAKAEGDSSRESSVVAVVHEQTDTADLQDQELGILQRSLEAAWLADDLVRSGNGLGAATDGQARPTA